VKPPPGYPQLTSLVPSKILLPWLFEIGYVPRLFVLTDSRVTAEEDISKAALDTDTAFVSGPRVSGQLCTGLAAIDSN
jgi:hypothetical protein